MVDGITRKYLTLNYHKSLALDVSHLRFIHIADFFMRQASEFLVTSMDTGIFYSAIQIWQFSKRLSEARKKSLDFKWVLYQFKQAKFQFNDF